MIIKGNRQAKPKLKELVISKILIVFGIYSAIFFIIWLTDRSFRRDNLLYIIIMISMIYMVVSYIIEWLLIWHPSVPAKPKPKTTFTVDVLTTYVKGEPKEMLKNSLLAIKSVTYPHETFLCDEANDPELKEFCIQNNIHHVTREKKINAKAGNINNALQTVAKGEIVLILDPDHVVSPTFLDEVLPYFEDEKIGFVQVVQAYYNQNETVIAKAAAEQTYQFYGPVMMTLNSYSAVPAIGANCTFRRTALDSIGGHAPGLTEDMHTALKLKAKGWTSVYNPVIVAKGLVPWNYSGYCLQQLKWSRGTFDLLCNVFPKVAKNLSWAERLAFLTVPFFYIMGIIALIDFLIPVIALLFGWIPINLDVFEFFMFYTQLFFISQVIRFYHQKWYFEEHEKGTSILGGILFKSTWWATLLGFLYALINKNVPYIPTPKDNRLETPWKLMIPNFLIIGLSLFAIVYGLVHDFTPFSLFMSFLAFLNILILSFASLMAMQKQIVFFHNLFRGTFVSKNSSTRRFAFKVKHYAYNLFHKNFMVVLSLLFVLLVNMTISIKGSSKIKYYLTSDYISSKISSILGEKDVSIYKKNYGQLYAGIEYEKGLEFCKTQVSFIKSEFYLNRNNDISLTPFLDSCYSNNILPFLSLSVDTIRILSDVKNSNILTLKHIYEDVKSKYLPIIIMFDRNLTIMSDEAYASFYAQSYQMADSMAINSLITWIWHSNDIDGDYGLSYFTKNKFDWIDWVYSENESALSFDDTFYGQERTGINKPLLVNSSNIKEINRKNFEGDKYKRNIVGILGVQQNSNYQLLYNLKAVFKKPVNIDVNRLCLSEYVKGVTYNPGKGRGNSEKLPLTVSKLRKDFNQIRNMNCNTIRRFSNSIYDYNLLKVAKEFDLDILYGFWFSSVTDYYRDSLTLKKQKSEVIHKVREYVNDTSIVSWGLGNETWGYLDAFYGQPYLSVVRNSYLRFINDIVNEIKTIDQVRPVFSSEMQYSASMYAFPIYVPQIDFLGVNSYYKENIKRLKVEAQRNLNGIPYLVSEYGNKGYWDEELNDVDGYNQILEESSMQKAMEYKENWNKYILSDKSNNLGGVAFCWQDRFEFSAIWFGIIDIFGNKKPAYYALKDAYSDSLKDNSLDQFPIPEFKIAVNYDVGKRNVINAKALAVKEEMYNDLQFKWIVYTDWNFDKIEETDFEHDKTDFSFSLPDNFTPYRIYLYVKDNVGNVITESLPIASVNEYTTNRSN